MADTRINALGTTATATAADDFFVIDGTTNGTRKHSAYTPVFSTVTASGSMAITGATGSLTLGAATETLAIAVTAAGAGTITPKSGQALTIASGSVLSVANTTDSTTKDTGALVVKGGAGFEKALTVGGKLTVNGTDASTFGGEIATFKGQVTMRALNGTGPFVQWTETSAADRGVLGFEAGSSTLKYRAQGYSMATGTEVFSITSTGNITALGSITTAAPTTGTAGAWKLGIKVDATTTLDTTKYLQVDVGGTLYKVALVTS